MPQDRRWQLQVQALLHDPLKPRTQCCPAGGLCPKMVPQELTRFFTRNRPAKPAGVGRNPGTYVQIDRNVKPGPILQALMVIGA